MSIRVRSANAITLRQSSEMNKRSSICKIWSGISTLTAGFTFSRFAAVRACDDGGSSLDRKFELENPPALTISRDRPRATPRDYLGYRPVDHRFSDALAKRLAPISASPEQD